MTGSSAPATTRTDLQFALVCGLGCAAGAWSLATAPSWSGAHGLGFVLVGALTGLAGGWLPPPLRGSAGAALAFAALQLFGPGAAVLARIGSGVIEDLADRSRRGVVFWLDSLRANCCLAIETGLAALAYLAVRGTGTVGAGWLLASAGYVAVATTGARVLSELAAGWPGARTRDTSPWVDWLAPAAVHVAGAAVGLLVAVVHGTPGGRPWLILLPVGAVTAHVFRVSGERLGRARPGRQRPWSVYHSIAHALARAVAAGDEKTEGHLQRVQSLAVAVGKRMRMDRRDLDALAVAALLHEIDRIGVAERILFVPGPDSPGSVERVRLHPSVGLDILDAVSFPYTVKRIVQHQHERWDGDGYPDGLVAEQIPLGSRILAAVDSYDVAASDHPQRRALPGRLALQYLRHDGGKWFDPDVIDTLAACLEAQASRDTNSRFGCDARRRSSATVDEPEAPKLREAQRELHTIYEIQRAVGYRLDLEENLLLIIGKLDSLVPHESTVVYLLDEDGETLRARFAFGHAARKLACQTIAIGQGLSGRALQERRAMIGSATQTAARGLPVEWDLDGQQRDAELAVLATGLVAPLVAGGERLGVLALYDGPERRFTGEERRTLAAAAGYVAHAVRRTDPTDPSYFESLTDPLTGLPNGRYLEISARDLTPTDSGGGSGFGLLAFRLNGLAAVYQELGTVAAERMLSVLARRLAANCRESEVPVRFGPDLFLVLCPAGNAHALVQRWDHLLRAADSGAIEVEPGRLCKPRLVSAHATCPDDGTELAAVLQALGGRLGPSADRGHRLVPFRAARSAG